MKRNRPGVLLSLVGLTCLLVIPRASAQAPSLGTAAAFGVLGGSAITNTGPTVISGQVGVSPGTAVTGFPPGVVVGGTIHSNDATAQQAQNDVTFAYNALAGLSCNTVLTGQDLGGLVLTSGVYCFASSAQLTGTLTLDAQGNSNAQFIFQVGSTLTTASNSVVRVINSGSNCNVYWQVGSSATLGTATAFAGNVLALTSITSTTGTSVSGRLLARNGAVTLDSGSVSSCSSCSNPIVLSPATLPNGTLSVAYNQVITAAGGTGPYTFNLISGALPPGITLSTSGTLAGIPTSSGSFSFNIGATDSSGCFGSHVYTLVINPAGCPSITLSPATLPAATPGVVYGPVQLTQTGGTAPVVFTISSGSLPPGLVLSAGGVISGTPLQSGSFTFTVTVTDANGCAASRIYTIVSGCPSLSITPATLPGGGVGFSYGPATLSATGGTAPYTFTTSGSLPPGITLSSTGTLSGIPTAGGSFTFTIFVTDAAGCTGARTFTIVLSSTLPTGGDTLGTTGLVILVLLLGMTGVFLVNRFAA